jgi:glycosyltransferase involved in cell wall biosynthesis
MARIVLADDGINFDGTTPERGPLGGAESSVISLLEALAARGHLVEACNMCTTRIEHRNVCWTPLSQGMPRSADLYIANRGDRLIPLMPGAKRIAFWVHNPASYVMKWRYLHKLWRVKPAVVFIGDYHATTYPAWAPGGDRVVIPYGIPELFRVAEPAFEPPPPRAIFTSNPLRSLDWLLTLWTESIRPRVPGAELHIFSGPATYGAAGDVKAGEMERVLGLARSLADAGVVLRKPVSKARLIEELRASRTMLYRGDLNETFCLAVGEAQAVGVPAVVQNLGSVVERVRDGETGRVVSNDGDFADAAVAILSDDEIWRRYHDRALAIQRSWSWDDAAARFEDLIP